MIPENLLAKIEKLIAMRDHENTSQEESENAAKRIQEILLKYNIEQDTLNKALGGKAKAEEYGILRFSMDKYQTKNDANWATGLLHVLALHNLCKVIQIDNVPGAKTCYVHLIGTQVNVDVLLYLFNNIHQQIKEAESRAYKVYEGNITNRNTYRRGYYRGAIAGINKKLQESTEELKKLNEGMGLMIISKQEQLDIFVQQEFRGLRSTKATKLSGRDGYVDGYKKGVTIEANKAIK